MRRKTGTLWLALFAAYAIVDLAYYDTLQKWSVRMALHKKEFITIGWHKVWQSIENRKLCKISFLIALGVKQAQARNVTK